jgi:hypothetical protein
MTSSNRPSGLAPFGLPIERAPVIECSRFGSCDEDKKREARTWFGYAIVLFSLVLSEALLAPTLSLNGDSTWHFKWASDILAAKPIFWSGVDANRIFPDLLFALIAAALPGGQSYNKWVIYFCGTSALSLGLSLIILSRILYKEFSARILFFAVSCTTFVAVTTTLAFWSFQIMSPGYHGGSLSMVITVTALFLTNIQRDRMNHFLLFAFALVCTLLVMSNRYLMICCMVPLLVTALWTTQDRRRQIVMISATLFSIAAGLEVLHLLNSSNFYRLVASGKQPSFNEFLSWMWWKGRIPKELRELTEAWRRNQIILGLFIMAVAMIWGFWPVFRRPDKNPIALQRTFRLIAATSMVCGILFVVVMVDDHSDWRYRYLTIPFCLAVITLSTVAIYSFNFKKQFWLVAAFVSVSSLIIVSVWLSNGFWRRISALLADHHSVTIHNWLASYWAANEEVSVRPFFLSLIGLAVISVYPFGLKRRALLPALCLSALSLMMAGVWVSLDSFGRTYEMQFRADLVQLSGLLAKHDGMTIHNGFANFWIANEVSARSSDIRVLTGLTWLDEPRYWFYSNNAWELCSQRDFSFILVQEEENQLHVEAIVSQIGLPSSRQRIQLGRFGPVQILFYDSKLLDKVIIEPARVAAREEFANFHCPNSFASSSPSEISRNFRAGAM